MKPKKIISGGQTGADQGALVAARQLGIETGGWMPLGARTEAGCCPALLELYGLKEDSSPEYPPRTRKNVRDSDATAWFGTLKSAGHHCTKKACDEYERPFKVIRSPEQLQRFVAEFNVEVLNCAGNRQSTNRGIHRWTAELIIEAFKADFL